MARLALSVVVLMVAVIALSEGMRGVGPKKCCFRFNEKEVSQEKVLSYAKTTQRCSVPAILLRTKAGREMCVRPSATWVQNIISYLDNKPNPGETSSM